MHPSHAIVASSVALFLGKSLCANSFQLITSEHLSYVLRTYKSLTANSLHLTADREQLLRSRGHRDKATLRLNGCGVDHRSTPAHTVVHSRSSKGRSL